MRMNHKDWRGCWPIAAVTLVLATAAEAGPSHVEGRLSFVYEDRHDKSTLHMAVTHDDGSATPVRFSPDVVDAAGGPFALRGRHVRVALDETGRALSVHVLGEPPQAPFVPPAGPHKWANVLCKFSDVAGEPHAPAAVAGMFSPIYPGLRHYWAEVSYGRVNISDTIGHGWVTLPGTRGYYLALGSPNPWTMLDALFRDCTAAADAALDYRQFFGINMLFNEEIGGSAWGGGICAVLDGLYRCWPLTWMPPGAASHHSVYAHEMGHAYGLPHSDNFDGDSNPYDNPWDVMSNMWERCQWVAPFGCLGRGTISHHKDLLAVIEPARRLVVPTATPGTYNVSLTDLALPPTAGYSIVVVPLAGGDFFTVEARRGGGTNYDRDLSGSGVVIHRVTPGTSAPARLVGGFSDGASAGEPAVWVPGETFTDYGNSVQVRVLAATSMGYDVEVSRGQVSGPQPDLRVTQQDLPDPAEGQVLYNVTLANLGPGTATGVVLTDDLPGKLRFQSVAPTPACTQSDGWKILCQVGTLVPGATFTASVRARPTVTGTVTHQVDAGAHQTDANPADNRAIETTSVTARSDLALTLSARPSPAGRGTAMRHHVDVRNEGGLNVGPFETAFTVPSTLQFNAWWWWYGTGTGASVSCSEANRTIRCTGTHLGPDDWVHIEVEGTPPELGQIAATASATVGPEDWRTDNNSAALNTRVIARLDRAKGDFDRDGKIDLVLRNVTTGAAEIWLMDGVQRVGTPVPVSPAPNGAEWRIVGVDDFNGDGTSDLVLRHSSTGSVEIWPMGGSSGATRIGTPHVLTDLPAPSVDWAPVATGDFNDDGAPDILWQNRLTLKLLIWTMAGPAQLGQIVPAPDQPVDGGWGAVAALDYDKDGNRDLLWQNSVSGKTVVWLMDAAVRRITGRFTSPVNPGDANWKLVASADYGAGLNGVDDTPDLVWRNLNSGRLVVWHMDAAGVRTNGTFTTPAAPSDPLAWEVAGPR